MSLFTSLPSTQSLINCLTQISQSSSSVQSRQNGTTDSFGITFPRTPPSPSKSLSSSSGSNGSKCSSTIQPGFQIICPPDSDSDSDCEEEISLSSCSDIEPLHTSRYRNNTRKRLVISLSSDEDESITSIHSVNTAMGPSIPINSASVSNTNPPLIPISLPEIENNEIENEMDVSDEFEAGLLNIDLGGGRDVTTNFTEVVSNEIETPSVLPSYDINEISRSISAGSTSVISAEERIVNMETDATTKNYMLKKNADYKYFMELILKHCNNPLIVSAAGHFYIDKAGKSCNALVELLVGEKSNAKQIILNECLQIFVKFGRMRKKYQHKEIGDMLEPNSFQQKVKHIHSVLQIEGCKYSFWTDFKGKGEWISVLYSRWEKEMQVNPRFGQKPHAAVFDPNCVDKVRKALQNGTIDMKNSHHRVVLVVFVLGEGFWFRGSEELAYRNVSEFTFEVRPSHTCRLRKVVAQIPEDKAHKLRIGKDYVMPRPKFVLESPGDPYCRFRIMQEWIKDRPIDKKLPDRILVKENDKTKGYGRVIGNNQIPILCQEFAGIVGFVMPEGKKCKPHGNRKAGVTGACHNAETMAEKQMVADKAGHTTDACMHIYNRPSAKDHIEFTAKYQGVNALPNDQDEKKFAVGKPLTEIIPKKNEACVDDETAKPETTEPYHPQEKTYPNTPLSSDVVPKRQFECVQNELESCERKLEKKKQKIMTLKNSVDTYKANIRETKDQLQLALKEKSALESDLSAANQIIADMEKSSVKLTTELKTAQKDVQLMKDDLSEEKRLMQDKLRDEKQNALLVEIRNSAFNNNSKENNSSVLDSFQKMQNEKELARLSFELNNVRNDHKDISNECKHLREKIASLKTDKFHLEWQLVNQNQKGSCDIM